MNMPLEEIVTMIIRDIFLLVHEYCHCICIVSSHFVRFERLKTHASNESATILDILLVPKSCLCQTPPIKPL